MRISDWSSDVCSSDLPYERSMAISGTPIIKAYRAACPALDRRPHASAPEGGRRRKPASAQRARIATSTSSSTPSETCDCQNQREMPASRFQECRAELANCTATQAAMPQRSDERRVGREGVSTCRLRWSTEPSNTDNEQV